MNDESCPVCTGENVENLGVIGRRAYFRCKSCGMDFSAPVRHPVQEVEVPTPEEGSES